MLRIPAICNPHRPDDRDRNQAWRRSDETEVSMASFERIIPILVYEDIPSAHDFLVDAFGSFPVAFNARLMARRFTERFVPANS